MATNVPLSLIIREAFNAASNDQITGEPDWTASSRIDIEAKVDDADVAIMKNLSFDQRRAMVRRLLVERFGLKYHEETKDLRVYALVVGKDGPRLHPATAGDTYPNGFKGPDGKSGAGFMTTNPNGQLVAQGVLMSDLARILSRQVGRTVIDKTGLMDKYDFTLQMPSAPSPMALPSPAAPAPGADGAISDDTPPLIFTDVEQLGLKLESQKAPLPVFVIDHIEQSSEN